MLNKEQLAFFDAAYKSCLLNLEVPGAASDGRGEKAAEECVKAF